MEKVNSILRLSMCVNLTRNDKGKTMTIEIYLRPQESPAMVVPDENLRLAYMDYWIDFREGKIILRSDKPNMNSYDIPLD
jgi:hypothetical protein